MREYHPTNGRLQTFDLGERKVMTNLAKNPTGFNQNIRIVLNERGRVLALFVNDNDATVTTCRGFGISTSNAGRRLRACAPLWAARVRTICRYV